MNGCEECIAYRLHHNMVEPEICDSCGKKTLIWKQCDYGTFYLECVCGCIVAVDLHTQCEMDRELFEQKPLLIVEPQEGLPGNEAILKLSKIFQINSIGMREKLKEGFSVEIEHANYDEIVQIFDENHINYGFNKPEDPRKKYPYYDKCKYPYSALRGFLTDSKA